MSPLLLTFFAWPLSAFGAEAVVVLPEGASWEDLRHPGVGFAEGGRGRVRRLTVDDSGADWLASLGVDVALMPPPPTAEGYRSPNEMVQAIDGLVERSDGLVQRVDLGLSAQGRPIVAMRLTDTTEPMASARILGTHHGDEPISATVALETAVQLAEGHLRGDSLMSDLLQRMEIWVVPHVNPDGLLAQTRHNAHDVDLNRNYGHLWRADEYRPGEWAFSEPETLAVQALAVRRPPALGLSLHSGAANIGWVWNHTTAPTADAAVLTQMADEYAALCTMPDFWTTNGAAWYPTNGDTNDWSYASWGTLDFTLELSETKAPAPDDIDRVVDAHIEAIVDFIATPELSSGRIFDDTTGRSVAATIVHTETGSLIRTSSDGRYARPTAAGTLRVDVPGHLSVELSASAPHTDVSVTASLQTDPVAVWPPILRAGAAAVIDTSSLGGDASLHPPGSPSSRLPSSGALSLQSQPPGIWVIEGTDALGILRVNGETAAHIEEVVRTADGWAVSLDRGGHGRELWLVVDGQLDTQLIADTNDTRLLVLEDQVPDEDEGIVDLAIWGPGGPTWIHDLHGEMWTEETVTPGTGGLDTGQPRVPRDAQVTGCGCQAGPTSIAPWLLALVPVHLRRRRQ